MRRLIFGVIAAVMVALAAGWIIISAIKQRSVVRTGFVTGFVTGPVTGSVTLHVWVYACDMYDLSAPCALDWRINQYGGQQTCTMEEPGATTGRVRCGASAPTEVPSEGPHTGSAPVAILD